MDKKPTPEWLTAFDADQGTATLKLSKPSLIKGVTVDSIAANSLTVKQVRGCQALYPDPTKQTDALIAAMLDCPLDDIYALKQKDYVRLVDLYDRFHE